MGRADIHLHTNLSDGRPSPAQLAARLLEREDLQVAAVTDHDTVEGALRVRDALRGRGPELVPGIEVTSRDGHLLALFVEDDVEAGLSARETIEHIHSLGGLAIAAHPFFPTLSLGLLAGELPFDGIEVLNGTVLGGLGNLLARGRWPEGSAVRVGGSDAHVLEAVGHVVTVFPGATAADLRAAILAGTVRPDFDRLAHLRAFPAAAAQMARGIGREQGRAGVPQADPVSP